MYYKIIITFLFWGLASLPAYSSELDKAFKKLISNCNQKDFVINLDKSQEVFDRDFVKFTPGNLNLLRFKETAKKKNMLWNYLRIFFPFHIPKSDITKSNYMDCYLEFSKFRTDFSEENNSKWQVCLRAFYRDSLPEFEKKIFKCADQIVKTKTKQ
ncbi:MAG: hypothetical protein A2202_05435 [Bdellovibrionales bacterium RIFOXYA1_FULL_36_14]|nr:MAG: hypothetical protein A2202_05435 [Bdellovibrionales bacterium RIFOXYA1_FULL_36_14]